MLSNDIKTLRHFFKYIYYGGRGIMDREKVSTVTSIFSLVLS